MKKKSWKEISQACNSACIMYIIFLFFFSLKKVFFFFNMNYCFFCVYYQKKTVKIFDRLKSDVFMSC